jgi:hypothetical protein
MHSFYANLRDDGVEDEPAPPGPPITPAPPPPLGSTHTVPSKFLRAVLSIWISIERAWEPACMNDQCIGMHCTVGRKDASPCSYPSLSSQDVHVCIVCIDISGSNYSPNTNIMQVCVYSNAFF